MKIIETPIFTKRLEKIVDDDDKYRQLQNILILNPESGKIIKEVVDSEKYDGLVLVEENVVEEELFIIG